MRLIFAVLLMAMQAEAQVPLRLAIAGDSTVATYGDTTKQRGWGQYIQDYFNDSVKVFNLAKGGLNALRVEAPHEGIIIREVTGEHAFGKHNQITGSGGFTGGQYPA